MQFLAIKYIIHFKYILIILIMTDTDNNIYLYKRI